MRGDVDMKIEICDLKWYLHYKHRYPASEYP